MASSLKPSFYKTLVDRSWRRSGTTLYRPDPRNSCCPHYTLRLDAGAFKPTRDQRQAVNRLNKHIIGEEYIREAARRYPLTREEIKRRDTTFDLVERIHESERVALKTPLTPAHDLQVDLEEDNFTEEKYQIFANYQRVVHNEAPNDISRHSFTRFLCDSPIRRETAVLPDGTERTFGSFHQCYRIDGELLAVGVIDLLPSCVSAVYFFYHESFHKYSPGKIGALREIALAREAGYGWWYPGFYIHSCPKMRYKIDYSPQYILDPEDLTWSLLDREILHLLDMKPYISPSRDRSKPSEKLSESETTKHSAPSQESSDPTTNSIPSTSQEEETHPPPSNNPAPASDSDFDSNSDSDPEYDILPSLFKSGMPGIPPLTEILAVYMDDIKLRLDASTPLRRLADLPNWNSLIIAEMVAAIGADLIDKICIDFTAH